MTERKTMLCSSCNQNEATIHLTEIINHQMVEVHLCESCAEEKGTDFKTHFNFSELLSGLADMGSLFRTETKTAGLCSDCGLTLEEFGKTGRLGCANCYANLSKALIPLVKRVQRSTTHIGKKPLKISGPMKQTIELRELGERLKRSIEAEEFEKAAELRDQIRKMEEKLSKVKKEKPE